MAAYNARRAPNVSQYIANLNTIPSATDSTAQQDFGTFDDELALFTNTQFFDFDMNESGSSIPNDIKFSPEQPRPHQSPINLEPSTTLGQDESKAATFPNFQFAPYPTFTQPPSQHPHGHSLAPSPTDGLVSFPQQHQSHQPALPSHNMSTFAVSPMTGDKRKATLSSISSPVDLEEHGRFAAEEDKRRRNTAASARFRVKKKQREQALEKSAKDMSDKVHFLEARVGQLEMENKWLKGLITEKNLKPVDEPSTSTTKDVTTKPEDDRSTDQRKDGVGTAQEAPKDVVA